MRKLGTWVTTSTTEHSASVGKRVITLGTWDGNPIEWVVLSEEKFSMLVISRYEIGRYRFDSSPSNNSWGSCELRKFLKNDFYKSAFTEEEKKRIVNAKLSDSNNVKDNVFILSEEEVRSLLLKSGNDDYETSYHGSCSYCIWTRTKNGSNVRSGFATGCWCNHYANNTHAVRPAMWIKE